MWEDGGYRWCYGCQFSSFLHILEKKEKNLFIMLRSVCSCSCQFRCDSFCSFSLESGTILIKLFFFPNWSHRERSPLSTPILPSDNYKASFFTRFNIQLYSNLLIQSVVQICRPQAQIFFWICWLTNCLTNFNCQEGPWQYILSTN